MIESKWDFEGAGKQIPPHILPLIAARILGAPLIIVQQRAPRAPSPPAGGWLALIGDDHAESVGPEGFPSLQSLFGAATHVCVHSGEPFAPIYADAAARAIGGASVLLIETQRRHHRAWAKEARTRSPKADLAEVLNGEGRS